MTALYKQIASEVQKLRLDRDMSVAKIAERKNVSERTVRRALQYYREEVIYANMKPRVEEGDYDGFPQEIVDGARLPGSPDSLTNRTTVDLQEPEAKYSFVMTSNFITISKSVGGDKSTESAEVGSEKFEQASEIVMSTKGSQDGLARAYELISEKERLIKLTKGRIVIDETIGCVTYAGVTIPNELSDRLIEAAKCDDASALDRLAKFTERLYQNPSKDSVEQLYGFMQHNDIDIDDAGYVVAFKKIREDWTDCYTGRVDNSIGQEPYMPRWEVNDNKHETCSRGYHVCAKSYLSHFHGARVVRVLVDPADFVSIPVDYNNAKARVCKYKVIEEVTGRV